MWDILKQKNKQKKQQKTKNNKNKKNKQQQQKKSKSYTLKNNYNEIEWTTNSTQHKHEMEEYKSLYIINMKWKNINHYI